MAFDHSPTPVLTSPSPPIPPTAYVNGRAMDTDMLVGLIRSQSEAGFRILYDNYSPALFSVLVRIVKRKDLADDLLQDTFVRIWKNIDGFDPSRGKLFTWMLNIARNLAIDHLRSFGHRNLSLQSSLECPSLRKRLTGSAAAGESEVESDDFKRKALGLDPKCAEVIEMTFFRGWSHAQTAEILKLPLGTVKSRTRRALRMLKILYER